MATSAAIQVPEIQERIRVRTRPRGWPIMHMTWSKLLFMHWPISAEILRPKIPSPLSLDTHEGKTWIAITPFTMWNIRPVMMPPVPLPSWAHELNVRTYVHHRGVPGVWFFSLDIHLALAASLARLVYRLPYFYSRIGLVQDGSRIAYSLRRDEKTGFKARWVFGPRLTESRPGSLEYFLTERYCLYSYRNGRLPRKDLA